MGSNRAKQLFFYAVVVVAAVGVFLLLRSYGETLTASGPPSDLIGAARSSAKQPDVLLHVLLALVVVIILARTIGSLFSFFQQPPVVGEIIAGILLGPSLLGRIAPSVSAYVLPPSIAPFLGLISEVGVVLYMFLVGLELDWGLLRKRGQAAVAVSHASIVVPFLTGTALALFLYPRLSSRSVSFTSFSLFLGVSMSVTAFPVLARILTDRKMHRTPMGAMTLTCAAVDDVTAWCLLAMVVGIVQAKVSGAISTIAMAIGFIAAVFLVARPLMSRLAVLYGNRGRLTQGVMAIVFVALLMSALLTDMIGIHAVFGAFALGAVMPHDSGLARDLTDRLEDLVVVLLLPAFFAFTGLRTQIGLVSTTEQWLMCGLIITAASLCKFGGSAVAARLSGFSWRDSASLGILMNTRGLVGLIILNIGLDLKVISPELFAMLVLMALATTFATTPILSLIWRGGSSEESLAQPASQAPGARAEEAPVSGEAGGILAAISNPRTASLLVELAVAVSEPENAPPRVLTLVRRPQGGVRTGLREIEEPPTAPVLLSAIEHARNLGLPIRPHAAWSNDPARDIVEIARDSRAGWILIGVHQPTFGTNEMGGTVRHVLSRVKDLAIHVAIISRGQTTQVKRVFAVVDKSPDGRAALDLALRMGRTRHWTVHALLTSKKGSDPESDVTGIVSDVSRVSGRWLYTDVLNESDSKQLLDQTRGELLIVGAQVTNKLLLPININPEEDGCIVVVQGGVAAPAGIADATSAAVG